MTEGNVGHTDECRYYVTGNFNDCDCKEKELEPKGRWADEPFLRTDNEGNVMEKKTNGQCGDCKWWIRQGLPMPPHLLEAKRTKDVDFQPTIIVWCKRMPHTETDKDKDDWCGEFEAKE